MRAAFVFLSLLLVAPTARADDAPNLGKWYVGFALGSGEATLTINGNEKNYDDYFIYPDGRSIDSQRVSFSLEGGVRVAPKLLIGGHLAAIVQVGQEHGLERSIGHSQILATVTYFPTRKGLFVRGGVGAASIEMEVRELDGPARITATERGTGLMAGLGYALGLGKSVHFTVSLDAHVAVFEGQVDTTAEAAFAAFQLGLAWF